MREELYPDGVDAALDLVGTPTLQDTLRAVRVHGTGCFGGSLSNQYPVRDFSPQAHDDMEHDRATGKLVVRVRH